MSCARCGSTLHNVSACRWPLQERGLVDLRLLAAGGALAVAFGAGWLANGWRGDAALEQLRAEQAGAVANANRSALVLQQRLDAERDTRAAQMAAVDAAGTQKLKDAQDENDHLRSCIDAGTCGVRIRTVQRACPASDVPGAASASRVDHAEEAELAPDLRQRVLDLRRGIAETEVTLAACQESLDAATKIQ